MFRIFCVFVTLIFISAPILAQEDKPSLKDNIMNKVEEIKSDKEAEKPEAPRASEASDTIALSKEMHKIWPMRQKVERALNNIAQRLPEQERVKFKGVMRRSIDFDALEDASVEAMADIYSEKELAKMIDFYGSKEGRAVSHKSEDYERALQPLMMKMMDKALLNAKLGTPKAGAQSMPHK